MRTYKQFINGELVSRPGEGMIDVENPSSGQIMAQVPGRRAEDAQAALEAARAAQDAWAALPVPTRATALKKLAEGIRGRADRTGRHPGRGTGQNPAPGPGGSGFHR